jgi:hypothetical protein
LKPYIFSFTAASALISDFVLLARLLTDGTDIKGLTKSDLFRDKSNTQEREFSEFRKRLAVLNQPQLEVLATGTFPEQQLITHLALVKTYAFYKDFCEEVLLRKTMVYDMVLTDWDSN